MIEPSTGDNMYIIGHFVTSRLSGQFTTDTLLGEDMAALFLPDFMRCHEWGYANCFRHDHDDVIAALIRSHLLGDWWVHYGPGREPKRRGWAYRRMGVFARYYDDFFSEARRRRLFDPAVAPDTVRGFAHTMMEYALDTHLAAAITPTELAVIKDWLGRLGQLDQRWSLPFMHDAIRTYGISGITHGLGSDVASFSRRVRAAGTAEELAYLAGVKKFGLRECTEGLGLVREVITAGLQDIPLSELDGIAGEVANFISRHLSEHH
jgi:hypothetical protein